MVMGGMMKERPPPPPHTQNLLHMAGNCLWTFFCAFNELSSCLCLINSRPLNGDNNTQLSGFSWELIAIQHARKIRHEKRKMAQFPETNFD
jgi:hypothetical protein